jgi:hypothetical protein
LPAFFDMVAISCYAKSGLLAACTWPRDDPERIPRRARSAYSKKGGSMRNAFVVSVLSAWAWSHTRRLWSRGNAGPRAAAAVIVCLVTVMASAAVAFAKPASSGFEDDFSPLTLFSAPTLAPAGGSGSLFTKEVAALTGQGISPTRAMQAINLQTKIADTDLQADLGAAMGRAYAGIWLVPSAAKLDIGVTSAAGRVSAERVVARAGLAAQAIFTPVRATIRRLVAVQGLWDRKLARLMARGDALTGLEPQYNRVAVELSSSVPASTRATLKRAAATAQLGVSVTMSASRHLWVNDDARECGNFPPANCERSITAGVTIISPIKCVNTGATAFGGRRYRSRANAKQEETVGKAHGSAKVGYVPLVPRPFHRIIGDFAFC